MSTSLRIGAGLLVLPALGLFSLGSAAAGQPVDSPSPALVQPIPINAHMGRSVIGKAIPKRHDRLTDGDITYSALNPTTDFLTTDANNPSINQPFEELGDDVHMTTGGVLTCFTFGYFDPGTDTTMTLTATLSFYENDADNTILGSRLAGPYVVSDLPNGFNLITLVIPDAPVLPPDLWFGIDMDPGSSGPVIANPPTVGSSDVIFIDTDPVGAFSFNDGQPAVWMLAIELDPATTAIRERSWSEIKGLFRRP